MNNNFVNLFINNQHYYDLCHWHKCELTTQLIDLEFRIFIEFAITKITQKSYTKSKNYEIASIKSYLLNIFTKKNFNDFSTIKLFNIQ
jgi:hypothetical protein